MLLSRKSARRRYRNLNSVDAFHSPEARSRLPRVAFYSTGAAQAVAAYIPG